MICVSVVSMTPGLAAIGVWAVVAQRRIHRKRIWLAMPPGSGRLFVEKVAGFGNVCYVVASTNGSRKEGGHGKVQSDSECGGCCCSTPLFGVW